MGQMISTSEYSLRTLILLILCYSLLAFIPSTAIMRRLYSSWQVNKALESHIYRKLLRPLSGVVGPKQMREGVGQAKGTVDLSALYTLTKETLSGLPDLSKPFTVLGIESSCDDTGVAIVRSDGTILSNIVYSQYSIHEKFGGVVPTLAMEAHRYVKNDCFTYPFKNRLRMK